MGPGYKENKYEPNGAYSREEHVGGVAARATVIGAGGRVIDRRRRMIHQYKTRACERKKMNSDLVQKNSL